MICHENCLLADNSQEISCLIFIENYLSSAAVVTGALRVKDDLMYNAFLCFFSVQNQCLPNPCGHGSCTQSGTSYSCNCNTGYVGPQCNKGIDFCQMACYQRKIISLRVYRFTVIYYMAVTSKSSCRISAYSGTSAMGQSRKFCQRGRGDPNITKAGHHCPSDVI